MSSLFCNLLFFFFLSEIKATLLIQKKITRREISSIISITSIILVHIELINGKRFRSEKAASKQSTRI